MTLSIALKRLCGPLLAAGLAAALSGCGGNYGGDDTVYPEDDNRKTGDNLYDKPESIFGPSGLSFLGGDDEPAPGSAGGGGIGVNSYLWRASLDTISFMPLVSADPFGGVIITDWYAPPETANERFKVNLYILGRELRADGVRASVFRQTRDSTGGWIDASVEQKTPIELEDAILTRARQMRIASAQ